MARTKQRKRRYFGNVRKLPSGRYQARYVGTDKQTYTAPITFDTTNDADRWLSLRHSEILRGEWLPPAAPKPKPITLGSYAEVWLANRLTRGGKPLAQTTKDHYRQLLDDHIYPKFKNAPVVSITPTAVAEWHAKLKTGPTQQAHAYGLLRTILNTAVSEDLIGANPCRIRGAGQTKRVRKIRPASLAELETIAKTVPERYKLMILLAAWCALRFGELAELRRSDIDATNGVIWVRRGVTRTKGRRIVGDPKSEAGKRDVHIPPHVMSMVKAHLRAHVTGRDGLLFPSARDVTKHMAPATLYKIYYPAREKAKRTDLRFHDLRHTGATLAAATGATLAELMARLGHSTHHAAMRYQHASDERDQVLARRLSEMAAGIVDLDAARAERRAEAST